MSINGSVASFLPFTINGLTDASFSNSNLGVATATSLTLTSATPLKLARFDLDKNLVSASVDESEVAVLTSNVFDGTQTMKPGHTTNINNVFETTIIANPPYDKSSFTTSGISGYTAPLGTLTGPVAGEYSISQTASDRSIMKLSGFIPEVGRKYVYTFTIRIIDAPEAYVSVEQGGTQRSNTIIQIGSDNETISDTFTFDPSGSTLVFKIYTGSLDPWTATWSSFSLGYYEASINAPINNLTVTNLATELLAFPSTITNSESWSIYAISTMGNPSTLGGIIFQEATLGVGAYITNGVVGAKSFQFNTLSGNAGKVVVTNADQVMSTSINAGQLDYITGLTSQAGGVGQVNTWTNTNNFQALRITSTIATQDYSLSVNVSNQLEFTNLTSGNSIKTNGSDLFVPSGNINCFSGTLGINNVEASGSVYLAKGTTAEWRQTLGMSDEYEIQDNTGLMRLRLSKTTGLTVSTMNITQVPSATPSLALGVNGSGGVVSFAVPAAVNILPLDNTFTGTNLFNSTLSTSQFSDVSLGGITTITGVPFTTGQLQTAGISSQANSPGTITFGVPATLTPSPTTAPFASCYSISQLFPTTNARYECRFTGFTSPIFGVSLTIYRANVANTARIAISATVPVVVGTFILGFLPNSNPSFVGQVFLEFSGTANKTMGWTSFTYRQGIETIAGNFTVSGDTTTGNITVGATKSITKVGGNSGANFFRLQGDDAGSSPYTEYHFNNLRRMYVGNASATDAIIASENSAQLVFSTQGANRMQIDTTGNTDFNSREVRISQLNSNVCQIRMKSGTTNIASLFHTNGTEFYLLATNSGDWTGNYNGLRPFYVNLTTGMVNMNNGLTINGGGLNVAGGAIECANQPFCIVGGVAGASVGYGIGGVWGSGSQLFAYTSAGMSNSGTSGWSAGAGAFFFTKTGRWQVNWSLYWNNFAAGSRGVLLHFNSGGSLLETRYCALNGGGIGSDTTQAYSTLIYGSAGDFLQCQFQSGGGTLFFGGITHTHVTFHFVA